MPLTPLRFTSSEIWMRQRAADVKIKELSAQALVIEIGKVQKEICLTTGLKVEEGTAKEFVKLLIRFLLVHYSILSCGEVSLAFTLHASGKLTDRIEFFGSVLTLEHIGKILSLYMAKRAALAKKLNENTGTSIELPAPTKDEQNSSDKSFVNEYYRKYLSDEFSTVSKEYAYLVYNVLDENKLITYTTKEKNSFLYEAERLREQEISAPAINFKDRKDLNKLMEAYINNQLPNSEVILLKNYAKRLAVFSLFDQWKKEGRQKVFEQ